MNQNILEMTAIPAEAWGAVISYAENPDGNQPMQHLLEILHGVDGAYVRLKEHSIPESVILATLADIGLHVRRCHRETGGWGLNGTSPDWLRNHISCKIFRVGRFQFVPRLLRDDLNFRLYRHKNTKHTLMLTAGDIEFRADGQVSGTGGILAGADGYRGCFTTGSHGGTAYAEGIIISPYGHATRQKAVLPLDVWGEVLGEGMSVLALHIPADGDFSPETCKRSFSEMVEFVRKHSSALATLSGAKAPFVAFTLGSWLLDAQLDGILPDESNLVRHLREYYLLPVLADETAVQYFVFDDRLPDLNNLTPQDQDTGLKRAIVRFMQAGGKMRFNFGVILFDDALQYGSAQYRTQFAEACRVE